jgi:hypothetical protein
MIDRTAWRRAGTLTIVSVCLLHLYQSVMLGIDSAAVGATPLLALRDVLHAAHLYWPHKSHLILAVVLAVSAVTATAGALLSVGQARIWLLMPQHFLLGVMAGGGVWAAWIGRYLDGTVIPWAHISADQAPIMALFLAHTAAILRRCWDG